MNIEDLSVKLGVSVNANFLQPAPNDLLVLKVAGYLKADQRQMLQETLVPKFTALGCKLVVLEGGMDVLLVKQAAAQGYQPSVTPAEDAQAAPPAAR